jgi:hypothetical protein
MADRVPIISGVQQQILKYLDEHADADVQLWVLLLLRGPGYSNDIG